MLACSVEISPQAALLGESILVTLICTAKSDAREAPTFEHGSLTIALSRQGDPGEPPCAFPNRRVIHDGGLHIRESPLDAVTHLHPGDELRRAFDLGDLFPLQLLSPGKLEVRFRLGRGGEHHAKAQLTIESGPAAVELLLGRLDKEASVAIRERLATVLRRLTGQGLDYRADDPAQARADAVGRWRAGWSTVGHALAWDYQTERTHLGSAPAAPPSHRSLHAGGVVYARAPLGATGTAQLAEVLARWRHAPSLSALQGSQRVGDARVGYPAAPRLGTDESLRGELAATLRELTRRAEAKEPRQAEALLVLQTLAALPSPSFLGPLQQFASQARAAGWSEAASVADNLVEIGFDSNE